MKVDQAPPTLFVMVGLPASGKTTRARLIEVDRKALRLTPDEWMIPLFGDNDAEGKRNILEGRLIWLALQALRRGMDVILDFGVWSRVERTALRVLAAGAGASCELVYLEVEEAEQRRRRDVRAREQPETSFYLTDDDFTEYRQRFEPPTGAELSTETFDPPPAGYGDWSSWISEWWPTSLA